MSADAGDGDLVDDASVPGARHLARLRPADLLAADDERTHALQDAPFRETRTLGTCCYRVSCRRHMFEAVT